MRAVHVRQSLGPPMSFEVSESGRSDGELIMKGLRGAEPKARSFPSFEEARYFVENDHGLANISIVLVPTDLVADSRSFWAHIVVTRGSGGRLINPTRLLISCIDLRRGSK